MIENHDEALARLLEHLGKPQTTMQYFAPLYRRDIAVREQELALVEAVAHLNCLLRRGTVMRSLKRDGAWLWERV